MKTTLAILSFLIVLFSGVVWAEGCFVPISQWQPRSAVAKLAEASGWTARRIKIDDGCYEIYGRALKDDKSEDDAKEWVKTEVYLYREYGLYVV